MSLYFLTNDLQLRYSPSKFLRLYFRTCKKQRNGCQFYGISHFATQSFSSFSKPSPSSVKSSVSFDYGSKFSDSISFNERLDRGVVALKRNQKRTGRTSAAMLDVVIRYLNDADHLSEIHVDFLFRCCGRLTPAATTERRLEYLKFLWNRLPQLGIPHNVGAYSRLQQMLLQNRRTFSSSAFLQKVRNAGLVPDAFIYLGCIIGCAKQEKPNMEEIKSYVNAIKENPCDSYISGRILGALVSAEMQLGNEVEVQRLIEEAREMSAAMDDKVYLNGAYFSKAYDLAARGNMTELFKCLDQTRREDVPMNDYQLLLLARRLASFSRHDVILRLLNYMPRRFDWINCTVPFVLSLLASGNYVTALTVLQRSAASAAPRVYQPMPAPAETSDELPELLPHEENIYSFFMDLFYLNLAPAQISALCMRLADCGYTDDAFHFAAVAALDAGQDGIAMTLLEDAKSRSFVPTTPATTDEVDGQSATSALHMKHFWNALRLRSGLFDINVILALLRKMELLSMHAGVTATSTFLSDLYSPSMDIEIIFGVFGTLIPRGTLLKALLTVYLRKGDQAKARECLLLFGRASIFRGSTRFSHAISSYYKKTHDATLVIEILTRLESQKHPGSSDVMLCQEVANLSRDLDSNDWAHLSEDLSKAGFAVQLKSEACAHR